MKSNYIKNILLSATIIGSISFSTTSAYAETKVVNNYSELTNAIIQGTTSDIQLGGNITDFSNSIKLNQVGTIVNIDGNGKTISRRSGSLGFDVQNGSTLSINNATIENFKNNGWGSAVFNAGNLILENVTFNGNENTQGYVDGAVANYSEKGETATAQLLGAMKFTNNIAKGYGGAIYNNGEMTIDTQSEQAVFQGNTSKNWAGALFNKSNLTMKGNILFGSEDNADLKNSAGNKGGAIYNQGTLNSDAKLTFGNNTAKYEGGAIKNEGNLIFASTSNNTTKFIKNSSIKAGAIYNSGTISSSQNLTFNNNTAIGFKELDQNNNEVTRYSAGGAIYNDINGEITLNGSNEFTGNSSKTYSNGGGAIYNDGTLTINSLGSNSTKFNQNTSEGNGGAINNSDKGSLFLNGNFDFKNNSTSNYGGAIYNSGKMNLEGNLTFKENTAIKQGGAIYNNTGNLVINGVRDAADKGSISFNGNKLTAGGETRGGAIYIRGYSNKYAYLDIYGTDFINNESRTHGGAIYVDQYTKFNIENSLFSGNSVGKNQLGWGGAIGLDSKVDSVYGYIKNSKFTGNFSGDAGGAIPAGTGLTIVNSEFYDNQAVYSGGAVSYDPKGALSDKSLKIIADGGDTVFGGNWVGDKNSTWNNSNSEGLYIGNAIDKDSWTDVNDSNVYFNAGNQGKIIFNDAINALGNSKDEKREKYDTKERNQYANPNIQLNQDITYSRYEDDATEINAPTKGTIVINNQVKGANLVLHDGVLTFGQTNDKTGYINPSSIGDFKYFNTASTEIYNGNTINLAAGRITLKGGTLDLINGTIESEKSGIFNPESLKVLGNANLRLDLNLAGDSHSSIDYIDSEISGTGALTIDKISFTEGETDSIKLGDAKKFQFVRKNLLDDNQTILAKNFETVITSNAGYTIGLEKTNAESTSGDTLNVTKVINAGGLPVAVSLGEDKTLAENRTYIYNATKDENITDTDGNNSWYKGYQIWVKDAEHPEGYQVPKETSNILKGKMLQINGNGQNVFTTDGVIGIEVGKVTRANVEEAEAQQLIINDVKKADNSGGWAGFNSALINNGGIITLNNSIFSNNNSTAVTGKDGNGGAVYNLNGTVNINNTSFTGNTAEEDGGAIYNAGEVNIRATDGDTVSFNNNTAKGLANDIFNTGTLNLAAADKSSIIFNGGISGDASHKGSVNIGYENNANIGNVILNNTIANQQVFLNSGTLQLGKDAAEGTNYFDKVDLTMNGGILNAQNGRIDTINLDSFTNENTDSELLFDVDLSGTDASGDHIVIADSGTAQTSSAIKVGLINVINGFSGNETNARIEFINQVVDSYMDEVDQNITINGVAYNVDVDKNTIKITKVGQSGGFAYEVINPNYDRTYVVTSNDDSTVQSTIVDSWIDGNNKLGGSKFNITGGTYGNKLIAQNNLVGIEVGESQELGIKNINSYEGFNSAIINKGGEITVRSSNFTGNNATEFTDSNGDTKAANGGVIQNNIGTVNINSDTKGSTFTGNSADSKGGAIYNAAGAILNFKSIDGKEISFSGNTDSTGNNDIYNAGTMNVTGQGNLVIGSGISGNGTINSSGNIVLNSNNSKFTGTFNQVADEDNSNPTITVNNGSTFFGGTSNINAGTLNWNTQNDIANNEKLTINNAALVVGKDGLLTIKGESSIDNASSVTTNGNLVLAKDMTVKTINGSGTLTANNSTLTFDNNSSLGNSLKFASNNATTNIKNIANADSIISKIANGENNSLTININSSNTNADIGINSNNISDLNFSGDVNYGGKITGTSGNVTNSGTLKITGDQSGFEGTFTQNSGSTTVANSNMLFDGEKNINGGTLTIESGAINYTKVKLGSDATLYQTLTGTTSENRTDLTESAINFTGTGASASFLGGNINLSRIDNGSTNTISFNDNSNVKLTETNYTGSTIYNFEKSILDLTNSSGEVKNYEFGNLNTDDKTSLSFNVKIVPKGDATVGARGLETDTITIANGNAKFNIGDIHITGEENGYRDAAYTTDKNVLNGATFNSEQNHIEGATTSWIYDITQNATNDSIQMTIKDYASANTLYEMNDKTGTRFFQFSDGDEREYHIEQSLGATKDGIFTVSSKNEGGNILSGLLYGTTTNEKGSFFNIAQNVNTKLTIDNITIQDAGKDGNGSVVSNDSKTSVTTIKNSVIRDNSSTKNGGALYNGAKPDDASFNMIVSNTQFTNNAAGEKGGAIYNAGNLKLENIILDAGNDTAKNDIYQTADGNTTLAGNNYIRSGFAGSGTISNIGNLILTGDNSQYTGDFKQDLSTASTYVEGNDVKFFGGTSTINDGNLFWQTKSDLGNGKLIVNGGNLVIGQDDINAKLTLGAGSVIENAAKVYIYKDSELELTGQSKTTLDGNDAWDGKITLNGGELNLDDIIHYKNAKLEANTGDLNINKGHLVVANGSFIKGDVKTTIEDDANLQINSDGNVSLDSKTSWKENGTVILDGGNLTTNLPTSVSNGIIQAVKGNLDIASGSLTVGANSRIESAVKTLIGTTATLDIIAGGYVHLGTDDTLGGQVTLNGGTLDYSMVTGPNEKNIIIANTGNLNLLENSVLTIVNPSEIKKAVNVDIQKGATVNLRTSKNATTGAKLELDANDKWNGLIASWTNATLETDGVDNSKSGGQLQQNSGNSIFTNKSNILIDGKESYIVGGNTSILSGSALHLGSGVEHFSLDNLNMGGNSLLNSMNNTVNKYGNFENMKVDGVNNVAIDVAPRDWKGDTFVINNLKGQNNGTLNISDFNFVGLAPVDRHIKIQVFDAQNINDVNFTASDKKIFTPIGNYQMFSQGGGAYTASLVDYNPQVYRGQVATLAAYNHQLLVNDMLTNHFILPNERLIDKAAQANKTSSVSPLFAPYQSTIDDGGIWTKTYVSFETLSMTNNLKVGNNVYGTLIGADFPSVKLKKGWKFIPTAYIGYNGGMQGFNNVDMYQNGGQGGFMGTFIKNNFIGSITAYGGGYFNEMSVAGNTDHTGNWFAGTAAKAAYNIHATKHFIIQPTAFVSYNIFGKQNWGTDYGSMSMNSGTLNGINVAPGMNLIYSRDTWSVYGTIQYMFNINDQVGGKAGNVDLPKTEMRHGYINYGIGATKTWKDRLTSYFQINFRNGGRTGIGFQLGLNYLFDWGKPKKKTSQTTPAKPEKHVLKSAK